MARAHRPLTSRPNTRLQPFRFPTIKHQLRQTCLTEESIHELLGAVQSLLKVFLEEVRFFLELLLYLWLIAWIGSHALSEAC